MTADMRRAARWYASRNISVFPCQARGKAPATLHGCRDAATDLAEIDRMWSNPAFNVGIVAGPSGLVIVDVDGDPGHDSLAAHVAQHGPLPATPTVNTSRGHHFYFWAPGVPIASRAHALGRGLDTRAGWAYCVAPPSVHPSGHVYRWAPGLGIHDIPLAPLPAWIVIALTPPKPERSNVPVDLPQGRAWAYGRAALMRECAAVQRAAVGERNEVLNRAAFAIGQLVGANMLDAGLARGGLIRAAVAAGLSQREALKTVNSGVSSGMRSPRQMEPSHG